MFIWRHIDVKRDIYIREKRYENMKRDSLTYTQDVLTAPYVHIASYAYVYMEIYIREKRYIYVERDIYIREKRYENMKRDSLTYTQDVLAAPCVHIASYAYVYMEIYIREKRYIYVKRDTYT